MWSNVVTGGAVYGDILAATEPYDLALPWGVAVQTGNGGMVEHCQHSLSLLWASCLPSWCFMNNCWLHQ